MPEDTNEQKLKLLHAEITYHRAKAQNLRLRADKQDRIADEKVKECAALGTGNLPLLKRTGMSDDPRCSFTEDGTCRVD